MMNERLDYKAVGFQVGIEIHQQILTEKKLFCHCPCKITNDPPDAEIIRHMRPILSELGEYDGTALMEFKTKKRVTYQLYNKYACTYEMDDTPPFLINQQALDIAIEIAALLGCAIVDEIHIIRKQYLDGSMPTGFQRTAIIGVEGSIPYKDKNIRIIQLGLEEDTCREISDIGHDRVFRADRLGFPLIEVVTYADMKTPKEAGDVAKLIRDIVRVTQKVRRGIGSVRQDVNVSINGGSRVEIKGVPRVGLIPLLSHNEGIRQRNLLELNSRINKAGITSISNQVYSIPVNIKKHREFRIFFKEDDCVKGIRIDNFREFLEHPTQPGLRFRDEIAGRLKVIACLDKYPNILTEDDLIRYHFNEDVIKQIKEYMQVRENDGIILVWGAKKDVETGINEIIIRCDEAMKLIPRETRQALTNGLTDFERILPGSDRVYPDTDLPPTVVNTDRLARILDNLPEPPWVRRSYLREIRLPNHLIEMLITSPFYIDFRRIVENFGINPVLVAVVILEVFKHLKRKGYEVKNISRELLYDIFTSFNDKVFSKEAFPVILSEVSEKNINLQTALENLGLERISVSFVKVLIADLLEHDERDYKGDKSKQLHYLMGQVMKNVRGRIDGGIVFRLLEGAIYAS